MRGVHICAFVDFSDVRIVTPDGVTRFEFSKIFGPKLIGRLGDTIERLPPMRDKFWRALEWWCKQGHRMHGDKCLYDVPPATRMLKIGTSLFPDTPQMRAKLPGDVPIVIMQEDVWTGRFVLHATVPPPAQDKGE